MPLSANLYVSPVLRMPMIYAGTRTHEGVEAETLRPHSASVPPGRRPHPLYFFIPAHFAQFVSAGKDETVAVRKSIQ